MQQPGADNLHLVATNTPLDDDLEEERAPAMQQRHASHHNGGENNPPEFIDGATDRDDTETAPLLSKVCSSLFYFILFSYFKIQKLY
jgi:hypothetical protein